MNGSEGTDRTHPVTKQQPLGTARRIAWDWIPFFVVAALYLAWLWNQPTAIVVWVDTLEYLSGAEAIVRNTGLKHPIWVGSPPMGVYPPGYGLTLAIPRMLAGTHWEHPEAWGRWLGLVGILGLAAIYRMLLQFRIPRGMALLFILCMGGSVVWQWATQNAWPDAAFIAVVVVACGRWIGPDASEPGIGRYWSTGGLLAVAMMIRPAALPLVGVTGVVLAFQFVRGRLGLGRVLATLALPAVWYVFWHFMTRGAVTYAECLADQYAGDVMTLGRFGRIGLNLRHLASGSLLFDTVLPLLTRFNGWADLHLGSGAVLVHGAVGSFQLLIVGFASWHCLRRGRPVEKMILAGLSLMLIAMVLMPSGVMSRHLLLISPFLFIWAYHGLQSLPASLLPWIRACILGVFALQTVGNLRFTPEIIRVGGFELARRQSQDMGEIAQFISNSIPAEASIASTVFADVLHLNQQTGRRFLVDYLIGSVSIQFASHRQQGWARADYVLIPSDSPLSDAVRPVVSEVFRTASGRSSLLKVDPEAEKAWRRARSYPSPVVPSGN